MEWEDVSGAIIKDFLPPPTSADVLYRRAIFLVGGECDTTYSNEVLVEVETSPLAPTLPPDTIFQKCASSTITIDATASGGTGPYTYSWSPTTGLSAAGGCGTFPNCPVMDVNVSVSTVYIVEVTDANGCVQTEQYTVNVYTPQVGAGPDVASCDGTGVQIGSPHPAPGTAGFTYDWTPKDGTLSCTDCPQSIAEPATTTTYTLTVTGPDGCVEMDDVLVSVVTVTADAGPDSVAICMGSPYDLGEANATGFTYSWAPVNFIDNALISMPEYQVGFLPTPNPYKYYFTKTHTASGCQDVDSILVFNLEVDAGEDGCGPRFVGTPDPHGFDVTYDWTIAQVVGGTSADVTVSCTDCPQPYIDYDRSMVEVYMSVCVSYLSESCCDTVWLPDCGCPFPDPEAISDAGCALGDPSYNTSLYAVLQDTANFDFVWTADTNGVAISNPLGIADTASPFPQVITQAVPFEVTYTMTVTYKFEPYYSCSGTVDIFPSNQALPAALAVDTSVCVGESVPIGGPGSMGWSASWIALSGTVDNLSGDAVFNPTFTPTSAGTASFEVTVTDDATECFSKDTATVQVHEVVADAGTDISVCSNALVQIGAAGTPGLIYSWEPVTVSNPTIAQPFDTIYANTEYRLLVTDTDGNCPQRDTVQVTVVSPPSFSAGPDMEVCEGGSVQIGNTAVAGQSYIWSPAASLDDHTISNPIATPTISAPGTQTYSVTITNENPGCATTDQIDVTVQGPEAINAGTDVEVCKGDNIQIGDASNAGTIQWSPTDHLDNANAPQPTVSMPASGVDDPITYTITINYPSGCVQQDQVVVTPIMATADAGADVTQCEGDSVMIGTSAIAGYTYSWTPPTSIGNPNSAMTNVAPDANTTYTLTATSPENCVATDMVTVTYQAVPADAGADVMYCPTAGSTIGAAAQSGYTYSWSPAAGLSDASIAQPTVTVNSETTFVLTMTHTATGCSKTDTVIVTPTFDLELGNNKSICEGSDVTIGITDLGGGAVYSWNPDGQTTSEITVSPASTTTYSLSVTKDACTISDSITVNVEAAPPADAGSSTVVCSGSCTEIGAASVFGLTYAWSPSTGLSNASIANPTACPTETTTYTLTVVNNITGCTASSTMTVAISPTPAPPVDAGADQSICPGEITVLGENTQTGYTYAWSPTSYLSNPYIAKPTFSPPSSPAPKTFTYYLTMTDNTSGCSNVDTVVVELEATPTMPTLADVSLCAGSSVELCSSCTEIGGYTYLWSPAGDLDNAIKLNAVASPSSNTFYTLTVTDTLTSCTSVGLIEATVSTDPPPAVDAGTNQTICENDSIQIGMVDAGDTYQWGPANLTTYLNPNSNSSQVYFNPPDTGTFVLELTATSANTCTNSDQVTITVKKEALANAGSNEFICDSTYVFSATAPTFGTGTWSYISGPGTPVFSDINAANANVSGLTEGTHVFKWTITGDDICNPGEFDLVTIVYDEPQVSLTSTTVCADDPAYYNVVLSITDGTFFQCQCWDC